MNQHYFSEAPLGEFKPREIDVLLAGETRSVVTAGGVFSPEHLDRGTEILLRTLASAGQPGSGPALDIGCGWGPIALHTALESPEREVWAIDVNERSRELTRLNADRLGASALRVAAPEDVPSELLFDEIISNPPIRVGKEVLHGILHQWLPRLAPKGVAHLVVAKHLGADSLQRWIAAEFTDLTVERVARDKGFNVIRAARKA
ncbi:methyltransferase [Leucobacter coleopterorum]|uniref:Methyltransferase n=1 Tax=Leucobacter coleopterorum TaxID=2714933 RepID=A0ABX6JWX0_9MICO|nr:methyltransferase [Leucobacter coleopterorum]QIM18805.1 methyltransferase [Leucobacter coleopterorum]